MTAQQIRKQIDFLQIFRGFAALAVVFHHVIPSLFLLSENRKLLY